MCRSPALAGGCGQLSTSWELPASGKSRGDFTVTPVRVGAVVGSGALERQGAEASAFLQRAAPETSTPWREQPAMQHRQPPQRAPPVPTIARARACPCKSAQWPAWRRAQAAKYPPSVHLLRFGVLSRVRTSDDGRHSSQPHEASICGTGCYSGSSIIIIMMMMMEDE
eukprot:scaffold111_cov404-Prasinococcus_capsulatus_cf.AAC.23